MVITSQMVRSPSCMKTIGIAIRRKA